MSSCSFLHYLLGSLNKDNRYLVSKLIQPQFIRIKPWFWFPNRTLSQLFSLLEVAVTSVIVVTRLFKTNNCCHPCLVTKNPTKATTGDSPSNSVINSGEWIRLPVVSNFEERAKYMYQRETTRGERRVACPHISRALARGDCLSFVSLEATQSKNVSDMLSFRKPHFSLI